MHENNRESPAAGESPASATGGKRGTKQKGVAVTAASEEEGPEQQQPRGNQTLALH